MIQDEKANPLPEEQTITSKAYAVIRQNGDGPFIDLDTIEWSPSMAIAKSKQKCRMERFKHSNSPAIGTALVKITVVRMN